MPSATKQDETVLSVSSVKYKIQLIPHFLLVFGHKNIEYYSKLEIITNSILQFNKIYLDCLISIGVFRDTLNNKMKFSANRKSIKRYFQG